MPINSENDACISCENFMNFSQVTLESTKLICELGCDMVKTGILVEYLRIYWTIFAIFSPNDSALGACDRSGPCFPICLGTLPWQPNHVG